VYKHPGTNRRVNFSQGNLLPPVLFLCFHNGLLFSAFILIAKAKVEDEKKRAKLLKARSSSNGDGEVTIEMKRLLEENHSLHESINLGNAFVKYGNERLDI
jgi:hypothetical protein